MATASIIDVDSLARELRLAVDYASRAGLLRNKEIFQTLKAAEQTMKDDPEPDVHALTMALSDVAEAIAPITLVDLKFGRDPFSPGNQRRSQALQFVLTLIALLVLVTIGYFMQALQIEQGAIASLSELQESKPQLKLTALRKLAQYEEPTLRPNTLYDKYQNELVELRQINGKINSVYNEAAHAENIGLFPGENLFSKSKIGNPYPASPSAPGSPPTSAEAANGVAGPRPLVTVASLRVPALPGTASAATMPDSRVAQKSALDGQVQLPEADELCTDDSKGNIRLPPKAVGYPVWMKRILADTLSDFCFQLKILSPGGDGALLSQAVNQVAVIPHIKEKVSLRVAWFLPFLYGLLGAAVFLMRNVTSVRVPAMQWFPVVMRLSLGGVAGIVVGWFSAAATPSLATTSTLSVPFALAFLTGYGIDALFNLLDRFSRIVGEWTGKPA